jgi:hypothetical protein
MNAMCVTIKVEIRALSGAQMSQWHLSGPNLGNLGGIS